MLSEVPSARDSVYPENEAAWPIPEVDWPDAMQTWLVMCNHAGLFGKTFPVFCPLEKAGISEVSSGSWPNSGTAFRGEFWTHNTSESPSVVVASSLSDILETGDLPQRYFLSPVACAGILRRAEKRGRAGPV